MSTPPPSQQEVTRLLEDWSGGNEDALEKLISVIQPELHRLAHQYMSRERHRHSGPPWPCRVGRLRRDNRGDRRIWAVSTSCWWLMLPRSRQHPRRDCRSTLRLRRSHLQKPRQETSRRTLPMILRIHFSFFPLIFPARVFEPVLTAKAEIGFKTGHQIAFWSYPALHKRFEHARICDVEETV